MNALSSMDDHDPLDEMSRYRTPVSMFDRSVEETQECISGSEWRSMAKIIVTNDNLVKKHNSFHCRYRK